MSPSAVEASYQRSSCILKPVKSRSIWRDAIRVLAVALVGTGLILTRPPATIAAGGPASAEAAATYAQVAPILRSQCAGCHNPQGGAPFSLLTYEDAKQWGGQILDVTQSRYMPPWLPAPGKGDFVGARRLSDAELAAIRTWVGAGMPQGAKAEGLAATPQPEWALGQPDSVLTLAEPVALSGNGPDVFTNLVAPFTGEGGHRLRAIQIRPSDPQAVRSARITFDASGKLQQDPDWKQGIAGMETPEGMTADGAELVFWSAGSPVLKPRAGEDWSVKPGSDLLLTTHLKTTGKKLALQLQIGLYYESKPAASVDQAMVLRLTHRGPIQIAPGASSIVLEDSYKLPSAAAVTAIYPRAHFLAHSFDAYATTPAGKQIWLLSIPKWDVDWLEVYAYRHPVLLPKGSVIHWRVDYDNSAENPHNPSDPPAAVHGGVDAKDEADALLLEVLLPAGMKTAAWRKALDASVQ